MSRKSLTSKKTDSYLQTASSSLRKSINAQKLVPLVLLENDDEAERFALQRKSIISNTIGSNRSSINKRYSLSLSYLSKIPEPQLKEHISHCIKLNIENKINVKNAFSLEMIDFMTFMVTKNDSDNIDLQLAGTSLDVITKIYAYRVDGLYTEILNMAGALHKQQKKDAVQSNEEENEGNRLESPVRKEKKRRNHNIISTESALKGKIETVYPSQSTIGSGDSYTSDMLYQVILPNHANSGFYYHPYNDIIIDILDESTHNKNSSEYIIPSIKNYSHLDICPSFSDFKLLNWSNDGESRTQEMVQEDNENQFQFDLNISSMEKDESEPGCCFDISEGENNLDLCRKNGQQVQNIVDLRDILSMQISDTNKQLEYSFIQNTFNHWAGPSYWKIKTFGKSLCNSKVMETCRQTQFSKKEEIVLNYKDDIPHTMVDKFLHGKTIKIQAKTAKIKWKRKKITLPENTHYNISKLHKLYIYPSMDMSCNNDKNQLSVAHLSQPNNYDCDSENDMEEHCFTIDTNDHILQEDNNFNELTKNGDNSIENQVQFTGDNLVTMPKITHKTFLQYAVHMKKINMHQLKQAIWKSLILQGDDERINVQNGVQISNTEEMKESKPFSMVYKSLTSVLSETNAKALSLPVAFVSLLHLANEKSLKLSSLSDFSDIIIDKD